MHLVAVGIDTVFLVPPWQSNTTFFRLWYSTGAQHEQEVANWPLLLASGRADDMQRP